MTIAELLSKELLTPQEVARLLMVNPTTVIRYANAGTLRGFVTNPGSSKLRWRIYSDSVRELMNLNNKEGDQPNEPIKQTDP